MTPGLKRLAGKVLKQQAVTPAAEEARARLFTAGGWLTDTEATTPPARSGWAQLDPRWSTMVTYAAADVLDTAALARRLPTVPPAVLARERTAQQITARITHTGLPLDGQLRWRETPWGHSVLLPVHDEILTMVPEEEGDAATAALVDCMQTQFQGVPVVAQADQPSPAWADAA